MLHSSIRNSSVKINTVSRGINMAVCRVWSFIWLLAFIANPICGQSYGVTQSSRCRTPPAATLKIEKVIGTCQEEIKLAILKEALEILRETAQEVARTGKARRSKRDLFSQEERRIAGCLLQCVHKKVNAVDADGFPTVEGLVKLYSEGVNERGYIIATMRAVQQCLFLGYQRKLASLDSESKSELMCDLAYDVFDCVSDQLANYCSAP